MCSVNIALGLSVAMLAIAEVSAEPSIAISLPATQSQTEGLKEEAAELLREIPNELRSHKQKAENAPHSLKIRAQALREKITKLLVEARAKRSAVKLPPDWQDAVADSFRVSLAVEASSFDEADMRLKQWWELLSGISSGESAPFCGRLSVKLIDCVMASWIQAEPENCLKLLESAEMTLGPMNEPAMKREWIWRIPDDILAIREVANRLPEPQRGAVLSKVQARSEAFWNDENVPLIARTHFVADNVNFYHSQTNVLAAIGLLDYWEKKHPEALKDSFWLMQRYFVASIDESKVSKAAETFRMLERLVDKGDLDPESGLFKLVSQFYYKHLPDPFLALRGNAKQIRDERKKQILR